LRALVLRAAGQMGLAELPDPVPEPGGLVIRVMAAAICGTDMRIFNGVKTRGVRFPSVLGHEFSGVVWATGSGTPWREGQRVTICPALACGACGPCRSGASNICERLTAFGYECDGGFAEFVNVPAAFVERGHVVPIPDGTRFEEAALAEPLACVINGQTLMGLEPGMHVAVLGAGPIGLLHVMLARARGAGRITVVQRSPARRAAALDLGADAALSASEAEQLRVDAAIVAVGSADLANLAARIVRPRGGINLFAGFPAGEFPRFDLNAIHYCEHRVTGAFGLTLAQFRESLQLMASGQVPAGRLVSHRFPLDQAMDGFAAAARGEAIKTVIVSL
jgi:L-iditol 2-dehydrogenase